MHGENIFCDQEYMTFCLQTQMVWFIGQRDYTNPTCTVKEERNTNPQICDTQILKHGVKNSNAL